jgi:hypothetical protein
VWWRDGGIECADRRRYDRLVTGCQEMQTWQGLLDPAPLRGRLCRSASRVMLAQPPW